MDFTRFGKLIALVELAVDTLAVDENVEHPAAAGFNLSLHAEVSFEFRGQTGREGQIVSLVAVDDADFHATQSRGSGAKCIKPMPPLLR